MYKFLIRPLLFRMEAERAHRLLISFLKFTNYLPFFRRAMQNRYQYEEELLVCKGIVCKNRVGLAAGLDKGAEVFNELSDYGFGFIEVGTVTPDACEGNPLPRMFRVPQYTSLITCTGFNNPGMKVVQERLEKKSGRVAIGVNINRNVGSEGEQAVNDFVKLYAGLYTYADYFTINWDSLDSTLMCSVLKSIVDERAKYVVKRPILLKIPADVTAEDMDRVLILVKEYALDGVIATGPSADHSQFRNSSSTELHALEDGMVCGKGIGMKSLFVVDYLRKHGGNELLIIGAGGIMTPNDAARMIHMGADFVQIYSAFVYEGPAMVAKMIQAVAEADDKDER